MVKLTSASIPACQSKMEQHEAEHFMDYEDLSEQADELSEPLPDAVTRIDEFQADITLTYLNEIAERESDISTSPHEI
jgi:hypothetical protein